MTGSSLSSPASCACTMAVGVFDGVHAGHRLLIDKVAEIALQTGTQSSIMTFAPHPMQIVMPDRAPHLLTPVEERCRLILQAGASEVVVREFDENLRRLKAEEFLALLSSEYNVKHLVVGFNHRFGSDRACRHEDYQRIASELGMTITRAGEAVIPQLDLPVSSSGVRNYLSRGMVAEAAMMLTRPYALGGEVVHGKGMGRTIGFPTANLRPLCPEQLVPGTGVYACLARIGEDTYPSVVNIGCRPTFNDSSALTIEAHVIGLDADLYNLGVTLSFIARLRDEMKFSSLEALCAQIEKDKIRALECLS